MYTQEACAAGIYSDLFLFFSGQEHQNIATLQMSFLLNDTVLLNSNGNFL